MLGVIGEGWDTVMLAVGFVVVVLLWGWCCAGVVGVVWLVVFLLVCWRCGAVLWL